MHHRYTFLTRGRLGCVVLSYSPIDAGKKLRAVFPADVNMLVNVLSFSFLGISDPREEESVPGA